MATPSARERSAFNEAASAAVVGWCLAAAQFESITKLYQALKGPLLIDRIGPAFIPFLTISAVPRPPGKATIKSGFSISMAAFPARAPNFFQLAG